MLQKQSRWGSPPSLIHRRLLLCLSGAEKRLYAHFVRIRIRENGRSVCPTQFRWLSKNLHLPPRDLLASIRGLKAKGLIEIRRPGK